MRYHDFQQVSERILEMTGLLVQGWSSHRHDIFCASFFTTPKKRRCRTIVFEFVETFLYRII